MSTRRNDEQHDVTVFPSAPAGAGESALQPGTMVHEFRILNLIGEGGFGIVYLAHDESLERTVALKEYMPSQLAERTGGTASVQVRSERYAETFDAGMRSFINEARLLARFDHPSLLKVYRFFQANGTAYMAMPFYEGQTLKAVLRGLSGPPDEKWLRRILYQLLDGLEVIHAYDCYHRDIAPDNILLQQDTPILLDFGAARRVIGDMTQNLTVILKPGYAPIEQYADDPGMKQGAWTDIYALAGVVHFALTRQAPPPAVGRAMHDQFVPLAQRMRGVYSDGLLKTIDAALSVKPQDRPQSAAAFRAMLLASDKGGAGAHASSPAPAMKSIAAAAASAGVPESSIVSARSARAPSPRAAAAASKSRHTSAAGSSPWRSAVVPLALALPAAAAALWWVMRPAPEPAPSEARTPVPAAVEPATAPIQSAPLAVVPAPSSPPVAVAPPASGVAAPKLQSVPPAAKAQPEPPKSVAVAPPKAPEPTRAPPVAPAKPPEPVKAAPVAPQKAAATPAAPRAEETVEAPPPAKSPPQQVARLEPKPEPAPPPKAEISKPPVEVARVEPKAAQTAAALTGRYTGRLVSQGTPVGITLVIQSVQDGSVSGTASQSVGPCQGDYRMTGTVRDDSLRMRSTHAGGRYGDCSFGFRASVQGTKLVGETGNGTPLELSR